MKRLNRNTLYIGIIFAIATFYIQSTYANSGDLIYTIPDGENGMSAISMQIDSENNVYVLMQSGSKVCSGNLTGYSCVWEWGTGSGSTKVKVYQNVVQKSSSGNFKTFNDWVLEITATDSKIWGLSNFLIILIFEYILFFTSLLYGGIYGFRFFNGKK